MKMEMESVREKFEISFFHHEMLHKCAVVRSPPFHNGKCRQGQSIKGFFSYIFSLSFYAPNLVVLFRVGLDCFPDQKRRNGDEAQQRGLQFAFFLSPLLSCLRQFFLSFSPQQKSSHQLTHLSYHSTTISYWSICLVDRITRLCFPRS